MLGESVSTMIRSRPGPMPSSSTPRISAENSSGSVPCETVHPVVIIPRCSSPTGFASGQSGGAVDWAPAGAHNVPATRPVAATAATSVLATE